ncbi:aldehyde ferredoxin oxidoreductase N-terminal domain-containing protein [Chloroflexota bacterium]
MMETYGWVGKILRVDLTKEEVTEEKTARYAPRFIGGRATGARIYWDEVRPEVGALDPENRIIIMTGPVTGTLAPCADRVSVITKSPVPVPECFMYSQPSGHWGSELKFAGYDGIVIQGRAPRPVYLWIKDGKVEIVDAYRLWGTTTRVAQTELKRLYGEQTRAMVIGPAGENLCREAVITVGPAAATGYGGFGAVMASKNLKAIAVRGTGAVKVARPEELMEIWYRFARLVTRKPGEAEPQHWWRAMQRFTETCPIEVPFVDDSAIGEDIARGDVVRRWGGCFACPVACIQAHQFKDGLSGAGQCNDIRNVLEDEWLYYRRKPLGKDSVEFGILCQELGLSVTQVMGHLFPRHKLHGTTWVNLLIEAGIWTEENTGLPLDKMGSSEFFREYLRKVAYREGIGDQLAEGQARYLKSLVEQAETAEMRAKAKEIYEETVSKTEPNYCIGWQITPPRGRADAGRWLWVLEHTTGVRYDHAAMRLLQPSNLLGLNKEQEEQLSRLLKEMGRELFGSEEAFEESSPEGKVPFRMYIEHNGVETDSLPSCRTVLPSFFSPYTPDLRGDPTYAAQAFSAVTGIDRTEDEMLKLVGERGVNLERAIVVREGRRREHDVAWQDYYFQLFQSWMDKEKLNRVMDEYYRARGWDIVTGIPTREKLEELELKDIADELERLKIPV